MDFFFTNTNGTAWNSTHFIFWPPYERGIFEIPLEFFEPYSLIINAVVTPLICVIGLCGNGLGVFVIWKDCKVQTQSIYRYMFALMVFDIVYLLVGLLLGIVSIIQAYDWDLANVILMHIVFGTGYLDMAVYHTSSVLLLVMALERLNALLRPLTVKHTWLSIYHRRIIGLVLGIVAVSVLPFPLCFTIVSQTFLNHTTLNIQTKPELLEFYDKYSIVEAVVSCVYPILMLGLNIAIPIAYCRALYRRRTQLPNISSNDSQQLKVTMMVLWIAVLYTLLAVPRIFLQTLIFVDERYDYDGIYGLTFYFLTFTGDVLARLNSANDFFVYVLVSERYRKLIVEMFYRKPSQKRCKSLTDRYSRSSGRAGAYTQSQSELSTQISVIAVSKIPAA